MLQVLPSRVCIFVVGFISALTAADLPTIPSSLLDTPPTFSLRTETAGPETPSLLDADTEFDAGSRIKLTSLSPAQVNHLVLLGKVWGLLKYDHPMVTSGKLNWDYELFRIMPGVLAAPDDAALHTLLVQWIDRLGPVFMPEASLPDEGPAYLRSDLAWVRDEARLGTGLSRRLERISQPRLRSEEYYVRLTHIGNPEFTHEAAYRDIKLPDSGFQLLGLFRLWNCVEYWSPYRDRLLENWNTVLREFIPRIALASDANTYQLELFALLAKIGDSHSTFNGNATRVRPPRGDGELPFFRVVGKRIVVNRLISGLAPSGDGLQPGDVLDAIDGQSVDRLIEAWAPYYPASNDTARLRDMASFIGRGPVRPVKLTLERDGACVIRETTRVPREELRGIVPWHDLTGPAFRLLSNDIAYLKLSTVDPADIDTYVAEAAGTKGWIIDLRNYPRFIVFDLGGHFVDKPTTFARFTGADLSDPGTFRFRGVSTLRPNAPYYGGKLVVLVDEVSQSAAEYTAMALQATPHSIVVGSTTAGADGDVSEIRLPGGYVTWISGVGVFYPDGRPTQQIGVKIDVEADQTIAGLRSGRDEVLEAAIRQVLPNASEESVRRIAMPSLER